MSLKFYLNIFFCILPFLILAKNIDPISLDAEISKLNDQQQYEISFLKLDNIIGDPDSNSFDKAHAYIQMAYTFKRVYNYVMTINKLELAKIEALKSTHKEELLAKIKAEKLFVYFDMQDWENVLLHLEKFDSNSVALLTKETRAFYFTVVATEAIWREDFKEAKVGYNQAVSILEKEDPKHLPNIYRAMMAMYSTLGNNAMVMELFEKGMFYAEKYDVEIYKIILYEGLTKHYENINDDENAKKTQQIVSERRAKYDAANNSEQLLLLKKNIEEERKNLALEAKKMKNLYLFIISGFVLVLIIVLLLLVHLYKQKNKLILNENRYIRSEVERLSTLIDTSNTSNSVIEKHNLTERQLEVVKLVKVGKTNKEIGNELYISENTVKYHLKAIYEILDVPNRIILRQKF